MIDKTEKSWLSFIWITGITIGVGCIPLIIYPFSEYFGKSGEFADSNHGPLYFIDEIPNVNLVDLIINYLIGWPLMITLFLSIIFSGYYMLRINIKRGLLFFIPALLSILFIILQLSTIFWLVD